MESDFRFEEGVSTKQKQHGRSGSHHQKSRSASLSSLWEHRNTVWEHEGSCVPNKGMLWGHTGPKCSTSSFLASLWITSHLWEKSPPVAMIQLPVTSLGFCWWQRCLYSSKAGASPLVYTYTFMGMHLKGFFLPLPIPGLYFWCACLQIRSLKEASL